VAQKPTAQVAVEVVVIALHARLLTQQNPAIVPEEAVLTVLVPQRLAVRAVAQAVAEK